MSSGQHKHFTGCRAAEKSFADSHGRKKKSPVTNVLACECGKCASVEELATLKATSHSKTSCNRYPPEPAGSSACHYCVYWLKVFDNSLSHGKRRSRISEVARKLHLPTGRIRRNRHVNLGPRLGPQAWLSPPCSSMCQQITRIKLVLHKHFPRGRGVVGIGIAEGEEATRNLGSRQSPESMQHQIVFYFVLNISAETGTGPGNEHRQRNRSLSETHAHRHTLLAHVSKL